MEVRPVHELCLTLTHLMRAGMAKVQVVDQDLREMVSLRPLPDAECVTQALNVDHLSAREDIASRDKGLVRHLRAVLRVMGQGASVQVRSQAQDLPVC